MAGPSTVGPGAAGLGRSALLLLGLRLLGVAGQLILLAYLANRLSMAQMAVFALCYAALGLVRVLGPLGMDQASLRLLALTRQAGGTGSDPAARLAGAGLAMSALTGVLVAMLAAVLLLAGWLPGFSGGLDPVTGWAMVAALPAHVLIGLLVGQLRGLGHNLAAQAPEALVLQLGTLGLVGLAGAQWAVPALALASWAVVIIQLFLRHLALRRRRESRLPARFGRAECLALLRSGWPVLQAQGLNALSVRAPLFLAAATSSPALAAAAVAQLEVALRLGNLPSLLTGSVGATFCPRLARQARAGDRPGLARSRRAIGLMAGVPALAYLALSILLAGPVLEGVLPPAYRAAALPLGFIALAAAANAVWAGASYQLLMSDRAEVVRRYGLLRLAVLSLGALLLAPEWGAAGVAMAVAAGGVLADSGMALSLWREDRARLGERMPTHAAGRDAPRPSCQASRAAAQAKSRKAGFGRAK